VIGRLKPGVPLAQAQADLKIIADGLARTPEERRMILPLDRGMKFMEIPLNHESMQVIAPLMLGFLMVLLIACTNVANLLLARGVTRQQEIAVRLTLGAGRGRIVRQLLTENLLLCGLAAVVGLAVAYWTMSAAMTALPDTWGSAGEMRNWRLLAPAIDHRVVGFTALLAVLTTLAAGLLPALQTARTDVISAAKDAGSVFGRRVTQSRLRNSLVIAQVTVCVLLLSCAGLLARNMFELQKLDLGYDARGVFYMMLDSPGLQARDPVARRAAQREAVETVRTLPGVAAATRMASPLLISKNGTSPISISADNGAPQDARITLIGTDYFETLRLPRLLGRAFTTE
jgi:predicted lysophospholipase L1 biosynthesis ABC-type transport system permease subunit